MDGAPVSVDSDVAAGSAAAPMSLIYDGRCGFCIAQSKRLVRMAKPGSIIALDAHAPGVLDRFGGRVTLDRAMAAVQLLEPRPRRTAGGAVEPDWRISQGCEAVVRTLATRRWVALFVHIYYIPPVRWACDAVYRKIAQNRYRISRWWPPPQGATCENGACGLPRRP